MSNAFESGLYFGDTPLDKLARIGSGAEPWASFEKARVLLSDGDLLQARQALETIAQTPALESRVRLLAWHSFREAGGRPPANLEKDVLGVVVEVGMPGGEDLLAAYADRTAYYYNYSGKAVVWLRPSASLDGPIDAILKAARVLVVQLGPWEAPRRPPPTDGMGRLNILTPSGIHFGEAPLRALDRDRNARPLLRAATALMAKLIRLPPGQPG